MSEPKDMRSAMVGIAKNLVSDLQTAYINARSLHNDELIQLVGEALVAAETYAIDLENGVIDKSAKGWLSDWWNGGAAGQRFEQIAEIATQIGHLGALADALNGGASLDQCLAAISNARDRLNTDLDRLEQLVIEDARLTEEERAEGKSTDFGTIAAQIERASTDAERRMRALERPAT